MPTPYPENLHENGERQIDFEVVNPKGVRIYATITAECAADMHPEDIKPADVARAIQSLKRPDAASVWGNWGRRRNPLPCPRGVGGNSCPRR